MFAICSKFSDKFTGFASLNVSPYCKVYPLVSVFVRNSQVERGCLNRHNWLSCKKYRNLNKKIGINRYNLQIARVLNSH